MNFIPNSQALVREQSGPCTNSGAFSKQQGQGFWAAFTAALLLFGAALPVFGQYVYSTNIVGYVANPMAPGYNFISNPLLRDATNSLNTVLSNAPDQSVLLKPTGAGFKSFTFRAGVGWVDSQSAPTSEGLQPGEGAILYLYQAWTNYFVGQVEVGTNHISAGLSLVSSVLADDGLWQFPAVAGDIVYLYSSASGTFASYTNDGTAWMPSNPPVEVGGSFWLQTSVARDWVQTFDGGSVMPTLSTPAYAGPSSSLVPGYIGTTEAPGLAAQPQSLLVQEGAAISLGGIGTGLPPLSYFWQKGGVNLVNSGRVSGAGGTNLTISGALVGDAGNYSLAVSNAYGVTVTSNAVITVNRRPVPGAPALVRYAQGGTKIRAGSLLGTDADGDTLAFATLGPGTAQAGTVAQAGSWVAYQPAVGFTGSDTFSFSVSDGRGGVSNSTASVSVNATLPGNYQLRITPLVDGKKQLDFAGVPGRAYTVQFATSLQQADWQTLGTATAGDSGACQIVDPTIGAGQRVYRATQP